jgi:acetyl esterase/lipase
VTAAREGLRPAGANLVIRSLLTSIAFLLLALPAIAVLSGYVPLLPVIGGFGRLLNTDLPWLVLASLLALLLAILALKLGGGRFTKVLTLAVAAVVVGEIVVGAQFAALAAAHGASWDLARQANRPAAAARGEDERLVYATVAGEELHAEIWRAAAPTGEQPPTLRPGVLFIHGGAFVHGEPGLRPAVFARFADAGYAVADIEYRLAPPPRWEDARADVLCALGWFQSVAETYGVDPERVVVMGESAGGNLALIAGYMPGSPFAQELRPSCDVEPRAPAGVITVYPTADLVATWEDTVALGDPAPFVETYIGGTPDEYPDRYAAASVGRLVRAGLPPTLLITGSNDGLIRIGRMRTLVEQVRAAGSEIELVEVPFADHAFDGPVNSFGMQLEETILPAFVRRFEAAPGAASR